MSELSDACSMIEKVETMFLREIDEREAQAGSVEGLWQW